MKYFLRRLEDLGFLKSSWGIVEKAGRYYWTKWYELNDPELCSMIFPSIKKKKEPSEPQSEVQEVKQEIKKRRIEVTVSHDKIECREEIDKYRSQSIECPPEVLEHPKVKQSKQESERVKREKGYTVVFTHIIEI